MRKRGQTKKEKSLIKKENKRFGKVNKQKSNKIIEGNIIEIHGH